MNKDVNKEMETVDTTTGEVRTATEKKISALARIKALASQVSGTSPLTIGKEKLETNQICSYKELTLKDFDFIQYVDKSTGDEVKYPVVLFEEIPDGFYCGGMALGDLCSAIAEDPELLDVLHTEGLKLSFESTRTKSGNTYVNFNVL